MSWTQHWHAITWYCDVVCKQLPFCTSSGYKTLLFIRNRGSGHMMNVRCTNIHSSSALFLLYFLNLLITVWRFISTTHPFHTVTLFLHCHLMCCHERERMQPLQPQLIQTNLQCVYLVVFPIFLQCFHYVDTCCWFGEDVFFIFSLFACVFLSSQSQPSFFIFLLLFIFTTWQNSKCCPVFKWDLPQSKSNTSKWR